MLENFQQLFIPALLDVEMQSVPGHCSLTRLGSINKQVFGITPDGKFTLSNVRIVYHEVLARYKAVCAGKVWSDPLKVFIKQEPHKKSKILENRLRLIMSVSLIDSMVDRILFQRFANKVTSNYAQTGIMLGWSPVKGGYRLLEAMFMGKETMSIDKSAWDWSVPHWLLKAVLNLILRLAADYPPWWQLAVETRFKCLFEQPTFIFNDGTLGTQNKPGVMKSGCYLTIIINSIAQMILHHKACRLLNLDARLYTFVSMGDDTLQESFPQHAQYVEKLVEMGFKVKWHLHGREAFEFAGFRFKNGYYPAYEDKHLFQLEHLPTSDREKASQLLQCYQLLYYFKKERLKFVLAVTRALGMPEAVLDEDFLSVLAQG